MPRIPTTFTELWSTDRGLSVLVLLTTVGFGDITALDPAARLVVMLEALTGQLFPAILIARLVSMELVSRTR